MFKLLETPPDSKTFLTGIEILKTYIQTDDYQNELDTFHAYDITGAIAKIIVKDFQIGIGILNDIYKSSEKLTVNQQLAISHALEQLGKEDKELLKKAYDKYLSPIIFKDLKGDIKLIVKRFSHNYARELIVQFAEHLAEAKLYDEALALIRIFINDPSPSLQNEPEDAEVTFNYHAKILVGEESNSINTVRGWCAWALTKFMTIGGRKYLPETIGYVEQLTKDPNFYVRVQSTFPLTGLVQNRHTVMPKNKNERFVSIELAQKIESIAFSMLRDKENQKYYVIMKYVTHVFGPMRTMTEDQAWEALNIFKNVPFENDIDDLYPLFIYYALFRESSYKNPTFRGLFGDELYEKMNQYKSKRFEELLEEVIKTGDSNVRGMIAWQFWQLPKNSGDEFEKLYKLSYKYLKLIAATPYNRHAFGDIYYFANDYLENKPEESLELWQLCIEKEREYLKQNEEALRQGEWWPNHYNVSMLTQMRQTLGDERYINALEILLDYPVKFDPGIGPQVAYAELKQIDTDRAKALLKKLADNYPALYREE
jgi:hypothetical protein